MKRKAPYPKNRVGSRAERPYEKVLIVRMSFFDQFFMNCEEYMSFNEFDEHFPCNNGNAINAAHKWSTQRVRQRYSTSRLSRDASFSKQVLEAYGYRCAICGCDIREMLQAAHEHGYTVAETSYDDPAYGVEMQPRKTWVNDMTHILTHNGIDSSG